MAGKQWSSEPLETITIEYDPYAVYKHRMNPVVYEAMKQTLMEEILKDADFLHKLKSAMFPAKKEDLSKRIIETVVTLD